MKALYIALTTTLLSTTATADILSVHCPAGCPTNPAGNDLVFGHVYALSQNPETKFADWVAYEVNVVNFATSPGRDWKNNPLLPDSKRLEKGDYTGANSSELEADRDHQAPLASFAGSHYWPELNYLSNITPQDEDLNQGPWKELEIAVRDAVKYKKSLYAITGPLYNRSMPDLPNANEPHQVPSGYFKVVYDLKGKAAGFIMQQSAGDDDDYCSKKESLADIQDAIAFDLPALTQSNAIYQRLGCG